MTTGTSGREVNGRRPAAHAAQAPAATAHLQRNGGIPAAYYRRPRRSRMGDPYPPAATIPPKLAPSPLSAALRLQSSTSDTESASVSARPFYVQRQPALDDDDNDGNLFSHRMPAASCPIDAVMTQFGFKPDDAAPQGHSGDNAQSASQPNSLSSSSSSGTAMGNSQNAFHAQPVASNSASGDKHFSDLDAQLQRHLNSSQHRRQSPISSGAQMGNGGGGGVCSASSSRCSSSTTGLDDEGFVFPDTQPPVPLPLSSRSLNNDCNSNTAAFQRGGNVVRPTPCVASSHNSNNMNGGSTDAEAPIGSKRRLKIEFINDRTRRAITFSKRKAGIMKKAYELSTLTGTQVMLLVASESGHVYTFATPKLQPIISQAAGKTLIQSCLNGTVNNQPQPQVDQHQEWPRREGHDGNNASFSASAASAVTNASLPVANSPEQSLTPYFPNMSTTGASVDHQQPMLLPELNGFTDADGAVGGYWEPGSPILSRTNTATQLSTVGSPLQNQLDTPGKHRPASREASRHSR